MRNKIAVFSSPDGGKTWQVFIGLNSPTVFRTFTIKSKCVKFVTDYNSNL